MERETHIILYENGKILEIAIRVNPDGPHIHYRQDSASRY